MKKSLYIFFAVSVLLTALLVSASMPVSARDNAVPGRASALTDMQLVNTEALLIATGINPSPAPKGENAVLIRKAKAGEVGKKAVCPVMKDTFTVTKSTDVAEYKGKTYFFCCPDCAPVFRKDPAKYAR